MLYPPMSELLTHIDSRYLLVNVVARRARQIALEAKEFDIPLTEKPVTLALDEILDGKYVIVEPDEIKNI